MTSGDLQDKIRELMNAIKDSDNSTTIKKLEERIVALEAKLNKKVEDKKEDESFI